MSHSLITEVIKYIQATARKPHAPGDELGVGVEAVVVDELGEVLQFVLHALDVHRGVAHALGFGLGGRGCWLRVVGVPHVLVHGAQTYDETTTTAN